jgi:hypothetical protein
MRRSVIFFTTFILFLIEALAHFWIGKSDNGKNGYFHLPTCKEFVLIVGVLFVFSLANMYCADVLNKAL